MAFCVLYAKSLRFCLIFRNPMDCSPPGSSVHGILQTRILEWVPCLPPGELNNPGIEPGSCTLHAGSLPYDPPGKPQILVNVWHRTYLPNFFFLMLTTFKIYATVWMNLENIMLSKETKEKRTNVVCFHLFETSRIGKYPRDRIQMSN